MSATEQRRWSERDIWYCPRCREEVRLVLDERARHCPTCGCKPGGGRVEVAR